MDGLWMDEVVLSLAHTIKCVWQFQQKRIVVVQRVWAQIPHCDGHNCNHLWRLKVVTMRLVLESFKRLVLASSFWDFLWRPAFILQNPSHYDGHKCEHLWRICDSLKAVTMKTVKGSFKSPSLSGFLWRLKAFSVAFLLLVT
jgi:hypothetical protein